MSTTRPTQPTRSARTTRTISILALLLLVVAPARGADIDGSIHYQGFLRDAGGPIDGDVTLKFFIFDREVGGTQLWAEDGQLATVEQGLFNVRLGEDTPLDAGHFATDAWLEVSVDGETLTPRTRFLPVPYAMRAAVADVALNPTPDDDWSISGDDVYHENGNVGVGTNDPQAPMHVAGPSPAGPHEGQLRIDGSDTSGNADTGAGVVLTGHDGNIPRTWGYIRAMKFNSTAGSPLAYMSFATRGAGAEPVERMRIDHDGNVGIGTTDPSHMLTVNGVIESMTGGFRFPDGSTQTTAATDGAWSESGSDIHYSIGNVGIGAPLPAAPLHVTGNSPTTPNGGQVQIQSREQSGAVDTGGRVLFTGHDGNIPRTLGSISLLKENDTVGDYSSFMSFATRENGSDPIERMRIDSEGRIGIGTDSPTSRLSVLGDVTTHHTNGSMTTRIGTHASEAGYVQTYGVNGSTNAALTHLSGYPDHGAVRVDGNDSFERGSLYIDSEQNGTMRLRGPGGVDIVWAGPSALFPNAGRLYVSDAATGPQAGMYVDNSGDGVVWGDIKNFRTPNPSLPGTDIWYACPEGPEAAAYVRGTAELVDGRADVTLPQHFVDVSSDDGVTVQVTPLSAASLGLAVVERDARHFVVEEFGDGSGSYTFDYYVMAVRTGYEDYEVIRPELELPASQNAVLGGTSGVQQ